MSKASLYGHWSARDGVPAFVYDADHETLPAAEWDPVVAPRTRRHWVMLGNRAISIQAANDGTIAFFDEGHGLRWVTAPDPAGTGISIIKEADGKEWGTDFSLRSHATVPLRTFGPSWFEVRDAHAGLRLERFVLCPDGEVPWVLIRVRLQLDVDASAIRGLRHVERWVLRPRFLNFMETEDQRRAGAAIVSYEVQPYPDGLVARERFIDGNEASVIGPPATFILERLGNTPGTAAHHAPHPTLEIETPLELHPGEGRDLWFRFGFRDGSTVHDPADLLATSLRALAARLPRAEVPEAPQAAHEVPWHAALLTGGAARDRVIGGHTLNQGSAYSFVIGFNGAARDPLQHALPLVYSEPDLALSVLRNTCAWAKPNGDLPYALDAAKQPTNWIFRPSDQNLWALWLAAEYAAVTGDLAAFDAPLAYHPAHNAPAVPLREHLRRQLRFFVDEVGRGERGHVRILNADWNDVAIQDSGVAPEVMIAKGGSVLNSAMASWVLDVFAGLAARLGETATERECRALSAELRGLVAQAWNGRWFHRAYAPGHGPIGDRECWLEVQPWAILCGAADGEQARALLQLIDAGHRAGSPLGARVRWPASPALIDNGSWGDGTMGGIWYAINMTLIWAAARIMPALAWDEWRRMSLASHTAAYPEIWEGTLSGPDCWNAPESQRPGRTWAVAPLNFAMQAFPVNNLHSHAQPILALLRALGVEPTPRGTLASGSGGRFASRTFRLDADGHGGLDALGPVVVESRHGRIAGGPGALRW